MEPFIIMLCFTWFILVTAIASVVMSLTPSIKELLSAYTEYYIVKRNQKDEHN